jgi:hypothetical protein
MKVAALAFWTILLGTAAFILMLLVGVLMAIAGAFIDHALRSLTGAPIDWRLIGLALLALVAGYKLAREVVRS